MDKQDWVSFCGVIKASDGITAGKPRSEESLSLMFHVLSKYPLSAIKRAISQHIQTSKFAVMPADVVRFLEGSPEEKSVIAWGVFCKAYDRYGYYDSVRFPDPGYHYAIESVGGWERIGLAWHDFTEKEFQFRAADFKRLYEYGYRNGSWSNADGKISVPAYLMGFHEKSNIVGGYERAEPVIEVLTGRKLNGAALRQGQLIDFAADSLSLPFEAPNCDNGVDLYPLGDDVP